MTLKLNFEAVEISGLVLAKVGNPSRDEPLQTSKQLFNVSDDDQGHPVPHFPEALPYLIGQRFTHHSSLEKNEVNTSAKSIFEDSEKLLEQGCEIAQRLYSKSSHPNIRSGDLCISLINSIDLDGEMKRAICILKSESMTPFLSISTRDGDLQLEPNKASIPRKSTRAVSSWNILRKKASTFSPSTAEAPSLGFGFVTFSASAPFPTPPSSVNASPKWLSAPFLLKASLKTARHGTSTNPPKKPSHTSQDKKTSAFRSSKNKLFATDAAKTRFAEERKRLEEEEGIKLEENFDISKRDVTKARKFMNPS